MLKAIKLIVALIFSVSGTHVSIAQQQSAQQTESQIAIHRYGELDKLCASWSDGCVNCNKNGCSNIGPSCQPRSISCLQEIKDESKIEEPKVPSK